MGEWWDKRVTVLNFPKFSLISAETRATNHNTLASYFIHSFFLSLPPFFFCWNDFFFLFLTFKWTKTNKSLFTAALPNKEPSHLHPQKTQHYSDTSTSEKKKKRPPASKPQHKPLRRSVASRSKVKSEINTAQTASCEVYVRCDYHPGGSGSVHVPEEFPHRIASWPVERPIKQHKPWVTINLSEPRANGIPSGKVPASL